MESGYVINLYKNLEKKGIRIWIDGGWGVDALLGRQTRFHKDLDIVIEKKDLAEFLNILENYKEIKKEDSRPHNFVLADNEGHEIDVHVIVLDDKGNGIYGPREEDSMYPAQSLTGNGLIDGQSVRCISPEWMVKFHIGYELKEKDYNDVSALCDKFGIKLPEEYQNFKS